MPLFANRFFQAAQKMSALSLSTRCQSVALSHPKFGQVYGPFSTNITTAPYSDPQKKITLDALCQRLKNSDETSGSFASNFLNLYQAGDVLQHTLQYLDGGMRHIQGIFFYSKHAPEIVSDQIPGSLDVTWPSKDNIEILPACGIHHGQFLLGDDDLLHDLLGRIEGSIQNIQNPMQQKVYQGYWQTILWKISQIEAKLDETNGGPSQGKT